MLAPKAPCMRPTAPVPAPPTWALNVPTTAMGAIAVLLEQSHPMIVHVSGRGRRAAIVEIGRPGTRDLSGRRPWTIRSTFQSVFVSRGRTNDETALPAHGGSVARHRRRYRPSASPLQSGRTHVARHEVVDHAAEGNAIPVVRYSGRSQPPIQHQNPRSGWPSAVK